MSTAKLDIHTFETPGVNDCDFIHSKFDMSENLLVTQLAPSENPVNKPIDLTTIVQEQLRDPFCRQISKRISAGQKLPFPLSKNGFLIWTVHSKPVVFLYFKFLTKTCCSYGTPHISCWTPRRLKKIFLPWPTFLLAIYKYRCLQRGTKTELLALLNASECKSMRRS